MEKEFFFKYLGLLFSAKEKVLNNFRIRIFPIKIPTLDPTPEVATEPATEPTKHKKSKLKLQQ